MKPGREEYSELKEQKISRGWSRRVGTQKKSSMTCYSEAKHQTEVGMVLHTCDPSWMGLLRQEDCKLELSLGKLAT